MQTWKVVKGTNWESIGKSKLSKIDPQLLEKLMGKDDEYEDDLYYYRIRGDSMGVSISRKPIMIADYEQEQVWNTIWLRKIRV